MIKQDEPKNDEKASFWQPVWRWHASGRLGWMLCSSLGPPLPYGGSSFIHPVVRLWQCSWQHHLQAGQPCSSSSSLPSLPISLAPQSRPPSPWPIPTSLLLLSSPSAGLRRAQWRRRWRRRCATPSRSQRKINQFSCYKMPCANGLHWSFVTISPCSFVQSLNTPCDNLSKQHLVIPQAKIVLFQQLILHLHTGMAS